MDIINDYNYYHKDEEQNNDDKYIVMNINITSLIIL